MEKINLFNRYRCTYCGNPCDNLDHVTPVLYTHNSRKNISYSKKVTVPSCGECNSLLGDKMFLTIGDRAAYLSQRYAKRFDKYLKMPIWEQYEINELEGRLRQQIKIDVDRKESIKKRVKHIDMVVQLCPTIQEVWYVIDEYKNDREILNEEVECKEKVEI